ncbi:MAG: hypothetical protein DMD81_10755 [Candidatus Rokuibacteriota bacterium]|nr:MAG: hypothetical protein DMD81_10755 [Candidatus Rokubacteria bacterium]
MSDTVIVRLPNWLGDTVMAVPAIRALKDAAPSARVVAIGPWSTILSGQGLADVLVLYPRDWATRLRLTDTIRDLRGDVVLVLPNSFEAAAAARYWGGRRRIGFATQGRSWLLTDPVPVPVPRPHQIDEYACLAGAFGVAVANRVPRLEPPAPGGDTRSEARTTLATVGVAENDDRLVVGIHLGAAYGSAKVWPVAPTVELCRRLIADGAILVLLGPAECGAIAAEITRASGAVSLVGRDRPAILSAILVELGVLVAGDTGIAHLAAALGTPVVTLFGPTDPARSAPRGRATVIRHPVPCAPCFYRTCPIEHPCMTSIEAGRVRTAVHESTAMTARA